VFCTPPAMQPSPSPTFAGGGGDISPPRTSVAVMVADPAATKEVGVAPADFDTAATTAPRGKSSRLTINAERSPLGFRGEMEEGGAGG